MRRLRTARRAVALLAMGVSALTLVASPASARTMGGGGNLLGSVGFTYNYVPTALGGCIPLNWTFQSSTEDGAALDIKGAAYAGPVSIQASGTSGAECLATGGGSVSVSARGDNPLNNGALRCNTLNGVYERVASHVTIAVSGQCWIASGGATSNDNGGTLEMVASGELVPTNGDGVLSPIRAATFAGAWAGVIPL